MAKPITPHTIRTQKEVAEIMGITQGEVSSLERKALRKLFYALKEHAQEAGFDTSKPPVAVAKQPQSGRKKERK
jgi:transcriptional regulator with XRE-family HTH domain